MIALGAIATVAVTLPGVAAAPHSCVTQRVSCREARNVTLAWQTSTADPQPLYRAVRFKWGGYNWACRMDYIYRHSYNLARCVTGKHGLMRFALRWPALFSPQVAPGCSPRLPANISLKQPLAATKGVGCGADDLVAQWGLPNHNMTVRHGRWLCQVAGGTTVATPRTNIMQEWCGGRRPGTDLTDAFTLNVTSPTDVPSIIAEQQNSKGLYTWQGQE